MRALCLLLLLPSVALGAAPYADWIFKMERATADEAALTALSREAPDLARIWFYGNVYDLGIAGIPDKEKTRIRRWATCVADGLADTDAHPALTLELDGDAMADQLKRTQALLEPVLGDDNPTSAAVAELAKATDDRLVRTALYALLHRAYLANPRLGGGQDARRLVAAARGLAEGLVLVEGDLTPWRTLAAWQGNPGVVVERAGIVEDRVIQGLNALIAGDANSAQTLLDDSVRALSQAGAPALRVALMALGAALAADLRGDAATARTVRLRTASSLRVPWMVAALARKVLEIHVALKDADGAVGAAAAFQRAAAELQPAIADGVVLAATVALWRAEAGVRTAAGRLEAAEQLLVAARPVADRLREATVLSATVPAARRPAEARARAGYAAELAQVTSALALRRGNFAGAIDAAAGARDSSFEAADGALTARAHLALARAYFAHGQLDESLSSTQAAVTSATAAGAKVERAEALAERAQVRLWRGDLAASFANANEGLQALKGAGTEAAPLRARLHRLAAAVLAADGQTQAAVDRLRFAAGVLDDAPTALALAVLLTDLGSPSDARAALQAHLADPEVALVAGCVAARMGDVAEAQRLLTARLDDQGADTAVRAGACLALALDNRAAQAVIARVEPRLANADPADTAAFLAVAAVVEGSDARRDAAIRDWQLGRAEGQPRLLPIRRLTAVDHPGSAVQARIDSAFAARGRPVAGVLPVAVWWQRQALGLDTAAPRPGVDVSGGALRQVRGALAHSWALGQVAADAAVEAGARASAVLERQSALGALATAEAALRAEHTPWIERHLPAIPTQADFAPSPTAVRVWYVDAAPSSRVFVALPSGLRVDVLPGTQALTEAVDAYTPDGPAAARLSATLLPFAAALEVHRLPLEVEAAGPLGLFPLGALPVGGQPLAAIHPVLFRLGGAPAPEALDAPVSRVEAPCRTETPCTPVLPDVPATTWAEARGRTQMGFPVTADGLTTASGVVPRRQLAQADGRLQSVVLSARAVSARGEALRQTVAALITGGARVVVLPAGPTEPPLATLWVEALRGTPRTLRRWNGTTFEEATEVLAGPPRPLADVASRRPDLITVLP